MPEVRFNGFADSWEQRKLGDEFVFLRNNTLSRAELSDDEGSTFDVHYGDVLIKYGSIIDLENERLPRIASDDVASTLSCDALQNGDVVIADTAEDDTTGKCSELHNSSGKTVYSGLHTIPCRPVRKYAPGFLGHYLNTPAFHDQLIPLMQGIKVIAISKSAISDTTLTVPSIGEQAKISAMLTGIDNLSALHRQELEKLIHFKQSMLDKMFPCNDADVPEIRFQGFDGEWASAVLGDIATFSKGHGYSKSDLTNSGNPIVLYGRMYTNYQTEITEVDTFVEDVQPGSVLSRGNEVIIPGSGETTWDIACASVVGKNNIVLGGDLNIIYPPTSLLPVFLAMELSTGECKKALAVRAQGATVAHIHNDDIAEVIVKYPSLAEQQEIADFFRNLDSLISARQQELNKLKQLKQAFLQKMFV